MNSSGPRLARVTWNRDGWRLPSGFIPRSESGTYVGSHGYGHEEWLNRSAWILKGLRTKRSWPTRGTCCSTGEELHCKERQAAAEDDTGDLSLGPTLAVHEHQAAEHDRHERQRAVQRTGERDLQVGPTRASTAPRSAKSPRC
jgi:hypothetical protein